MLGDHIVGGIKESTRRADQALKEVQALHETVSPARPFNLRRELTVPINFAAGPIEITPVDYVHAAGGRRIVVRRPLTWTLSYAGYSPTRVPELVATRGEELQRFIVSHLLLNAVVTHQRGLMQVFEALRLPITTTKTPELGELPVTRIGIGVSTFRPSDTVVLESAELTGIDAFEEVVNVDDIGTLDDPLKDRLTEIARQHAPALTAS